MPTISQFFGIVIQMFWREHAPPHFHAMYGEYEAQIDIRTLEVLVGRLPRRALSLTIEWAIEHRRELMEDWDCLLYTSSPKYLDNYAHEIAYREDTRRWSNGHILSLIHI